jgi:hypothetical protein
MASSGKPGGTRGAWSGVGMEAALGESSGRKMFKSLVIWGKTEKGKFASSKSMC